MTTRIALASVALLFAACSAGDSTPTNVFELDVVLPSGVVPSVTDQDKRSIPVDTTFDDKDGHHTVFDFGDQSVRYPPKGSAEVYAGVRLQYPNEALCVPSMWFLVGRPQGALASATRFRMVVTRELNWMVRSFYVYFDAEGRVLVDGSKFRAPDELPQTLVPCS